MKQTGHAPHPPLWSGLWAYQPGGSPTHTTDSQSTNRSPPSATGYSPGKLSPRSVLDVLRSATNHGDANAANAILADSTGADASHRLRSRNVRVRTLLGSLTAWWHGYSAEKRGSRA